MEKRGNSSNHTHEHAHHSHEQTHHSHVQGQHPHEQVHNQHEQKNHMPAKIHHMQESNKSKARSVDAKLVENFVALQKVNTHLAEKFDKLANQISNLLILFETAARSFATSPTVQASEKDKEFLDKIDRLLDQNKTIAKGLTLMEERIRERVYGQTPHMEMPKNEAAPVEMRIPERTETHPEDEFKPSIAGKPLPKF